MSDSPNTSSEEYARGHTSVSRAYRALPDEGPPPELDNAILAKARAAVSDHPASEVQQRRWRKFAVPLALAASVVMTISVVLEVNKQSLPTQSLKQSPEQSLEQQSAPASEKPESSNASSTVVMVPLNNFTSPPPAVAVEAAPAPMELPSQRAEADAPLQSRQRMAASLDERLDSATVTAPAAAPPVMAPPPAPVAVETPEAAVGNLAAASRELRQSTNQFNTAVSGVSMAKVAGAAAEAKSELSEQVQRDPAQWLAAIQALRTAGNTQTAEREWLAFRKAWPNYPASTGATSSQSSQK